MCEVILGGSKMLRVVGTINKGKRGRKEEKSLP
jgi:hypothetical protein